MNTIPIVEIFGPSVQGEGPNAGARCIFVRVKGCDFSCDFCDSKFTWSNHSSDNDKYTPEELADKLLQMCAESNCHRVILTGGNPCLYDFEYVITYLSEHGNIKTDVETQGSLTPEWLYSLDTVVFSPKPPSSRMKDTYDEILGYIHRAANLKLNQAIAIKIPVFNDEDIEFARKYSIFVNSIIEEWENPLNIRMYLSVGNSDVDTTDSIRDRVLSDYEELLNKINKYPKDFENIYILPQIHTLVWGNKQGV